MKTSAALISCLLPLIACGAGATNEHSTGSAPAPSAAPAAASSAPAAPARRSASEQIRARWPFDAQPRFALYADAGGLLRTRLGESILAGSLQLAAGSSSEQQTRCIHGVAAGLREIAVGSDGDGGLLVARVDDAALDVPACLTAFGAQPAQLEGAGQAFSLHDAIVVYEPGLLVAGQEALVKRAIHRQGAAASFPELLSLGPDEYVAWAAAPDGDMRAQGTVLASSERFRIGASADVPEPLAKRAEQQWKALRDAGTIPGLDGAERELAGKLLRACELTRSGGHLDAALDLHEPVTDQARDLGMLAALGIAGVRRYLADAKTAEARNTIGQIAKDYAAWWEMRGRSPRARRKLVSFPAVPKTVPRGTKYQSSPDDWKAWAPLRFEMDEPQYFQYEVVAAKDGRSAEIIARGDLNGDGKTSRFEVSVRIDPAHGGGLEVAPSIDESDPEE